MKEFWIGYWFKPWYLLYKIGYAIVITGIRSYFKNHQYDGKKSIPANTGILYAVNHQNAFLDPIVIAGKTKEPTYFLTRADIFKKPLVAKLLSMIYMLPIYRQRDGVDTIKMNQKTFDTCYDVLKQNGNIIIFPEGNHHYKKSLRPLKKGVARIALGAAEKYNYDINLKIVPLGIDYEDHFRMNGSLYLNAAKPIDVSDYFENFKSNPSEAVNKLSEHVCSKLSDLIINIKDDDHYDQLYYLLHRVPLSTNENSVKLKFDERKKRLKKLEKLQAENKSLYTNFMVLTEKLKHEMKKHRIRPYLLHKSRDSVLKLITYTLVLLCSFPIHLIGLLLNYLPYKIPVWFVNKNVKDKHFHGSLKMAMGPVLFFIYWATATILFSVIFGWKYGLLFLPTLPFTALFSFRYWILFTKVKGMYAYRKNYDELHEIKREYLKMYEILK